MEKGSDKDYVEKICKEILEIHFPSKFSNLIKSERPDFYNDKCFIEVRRIILKEIAEFHCLFKQYMDKNINDIPKGWLVKLGFNINDFNDNHRTPLFTMYSNKVGSMTFLKYKNGDYNLSGIVDKPSRGDYTVELADLIFKGLCEKLEKLQNYQKGEENDVIFYLEDYMYFDGFSFYNDIINHLKDKIKESDIFTKYTTIFDYIYLFFNDSLTEFNLTTLTCSNHIKLEQKDWDKIKEK